MPLLLVFYFLRVVVLLFSFGGARVSFLVGGDTVLVFWVYIRGQWFGLGSRRVSREVVLFNARSARPFLFPAGVSSIFPLVLALPADVCFLRCLILRHLG